MALQLGPEHRDFGQPAVLDHRPYRAFGESLAVARINRRYTQQRLADALNIRRETIRDWEHGYRLPADHLLKEMVRILALRWDGERVFSDPIGIATPIMRLMPDLPNPELRACAFDPTHIYRTIDVPTPLYHSPDCAVAAMRREQRQRLSEKGGTR